MNKETQLKKDFDKKDFEIGASQFKVFCWYFTSLFFIRSGLIPSSSIIVFILRLFGSQIGKGVRIKPGIFIRYPWKLKVGDFTWLADCYIDNLDWVIIDKNCCISQQAVLITGNHNYKNVSFDLIVKPIVLEKGAWIGASSKVCPGITLHEHSILTLGSVATRDLEAYGIYQGIPAIKVKHRVILN